MIKHTIQQNWSSNGGSIATAFDILAGVEYNLDESIATPSTNLATAYSAAVAKLQSLFMLSDQNIVIKTNSSSEPANTFTLEAGVPFVWTINDPALRDTAGASVVDITSFFITNAAAAAANFQLRSLSNP